MIELVDRPLVYVAAPYTHPDPVENTHDAIKTADSLHASGLVTCVVPHLTLLWNMISPQPPDHWYAYDLALLARCDALLRLPGSSEGADEEVRFAEDRDIAVFYAADALMAWANP